MAQTFVYNFPTHIRFGVGVRKDLESVLTDAGVCRPLFVTDRGVADLNWFTGLATSLSSGFETAVFSEIWGNPVTSQVMAGVVAAQSHSADAIIAVGGGAPVDVAKAIALMQHHPGHLFDYEDGKPDGRLVDQAYHSLWPYQLQPERAVRLVEVLLFQTMKPMRRKLFSPRMLPQVVLADPELTLGLPANITAATGFDALTHLVEAYLARGEHPMCDGIALEGLRLVSLGLGPAVRFASSCSDDEREAHLLARGHMLNASMMGAVAFQKGLGVNHSCAHALSTVCDLHHGLANAVMLETCMRFNARVVPERFAALSQPSVWTVHLRASLIG